jgi:hypothetical protein
MTDWNKLKVVDLKAELKKRGLPQTGLKPALVARLEAAENEDGDESETTVQGDALKLNTDSATSPDTVSPKQPSDLSAEALPEAPTSEPNIESSEQIPVVENEPQESLAVDTQPQPLPTQSTNTAESPQLAGQVDNHRSALPSVEPQEAIEDRQKRKRRSQSPPPTAIYVARKRFRQDDKSAEDNDEIVGITGDADWVEKHNTVEEAEVNAEAAEVSPAGVEPGPTIIDASKEDVTVEDVPGSQMEGVESKQTKKGMDMASEPTEDAASRTRDSLFKDLFTSPQKAPSIENSHSRNSTMPATEMEPDRIISPAIHPATSALYIRNFMRPLNPQQLKSHLATLATPPGHDVDPDCIINFYLDPIRTHAFILFTNVSAASRVRSALHDRIWPDERTRKPLWVDFAPVDRLDQWIAEEQGTKLGGRSQAKKWEVYYDVDEDRHVTATLQEATNISRPHPQPHRTPSISQNIPPQAPTPFPVPSRGIEGAPSGPRASAQIRDERAAANLSTLDQLFKSTTAKPVLYWQPVSKSLANKRLDAMDDAMSKEAMGKRTGGGINRYTFEDGSVLVDRGPEIFSGIRPPPGHRGPRGGGPRGRGGFGGGGGREYDSYRGDRGARGDRGDRRGSRDDRRH